MARGLAVRLGNGERFPMPDYGRKMAEQGEIGQIRLQRHIVAII